MSTVTEKMVKQFEYQRTRYATSADPADLFVSVDRLADYIAQQMRADRRPIRRQVKTEMESLAEAGQVRRWLQVHGPSARPDRADHYFLTAGSL